MTTSEADGIAAVPLPGDRPRIAAGTLLRPRDAGTLVIVDESGPVPRILLGRRAAKLIFMPGRLVFPGGRLEADDLRIAGSFELPAESERRLLARTGSRFDVRRAVAVALAAIRETFEEAGAMIGRSAPFAPNAPGWSRFAEAGILPDLSMLVPVARAITPPGPPRRYDTRFFCASARDIAVFLPFEERPDPEFDELGWFSVDDLAALDLPGITRQVLSDIDGRLRDGRWRDPGLPMPFYRHRQGRMIRDLI